MRWPALLQDRLLRRKFRQRVHQLPMDHLRVGIAHTATQHEDAFRLLRAAYVYEGILQPRSPDLRITPQHVLPEATILVAYEGERLVATMTATLDSPAGLPLDHDFPAVLETLRSQSSRLVEFGSLAVVRRVRGGGATTLINMMSFWLTQNVLAASHAVFGVHPAAAAWHRAIYCGEPLGLARDHAELTAPVVGMCIDLAALRLHLQRHFPRPLATGATLAEHHFEFLPPCAEHPPSSTISDLVRWKLPREDFRQLFVKQSGRLADLDPRTRKHLYSWRSIQTACTK